MKKMIAAAFVISCMTSCDVNDKNDRENVTSETTITTDTSAVAVAPAENTMTTVAYTPSEGDVMLRDGKILIYEKNDWVPAKGDVTLDNGITVSKTGQVKSADASITLEDGQTVSRSGNFFDRAGHGINTGWQKTKEGVSTAAEKTAEGVSTAADKTADAAKTAGKAIKNGAEKVGEKTKEIVNGKDN